MNAEIDDLPGKPVLGPLTRDGLLLFITRGVRMFAYGFLSVVLVLYLQELGKSNYEIGLLLALTLVGDTVISLFITTHADRIGRKRMLLAGAALMVMAGAVFAVTDSFVLLLLAATIGVISPSGNEVGPFLAIEQAALSQTIPSKRRTGVFAWYNLMASIFMATGTLAAGWLATALQVGGMAKADSYRFIIVGYAAMGLLLAGGFLLVGRAVEAPAGKPPANSAAPGGVRQALGLHRSRKAVLGLSGLFSIDAFAGGFIIQSVMIAWFYTQWGFDERALGMVFFWANILAGLSALVASAIAARIGLIRTMVFTHLPSNVLLILVPLMPTHWLAITVLLLRFSISQMDVPTRQSYVMAIVEPDERSAAAGVTGIARTLGASISQLFLGVVTSLGTVTGVAVLAGAPFFISGGLKIVYDLLLLRSFQHHRPPEERK